MKSMVCLLVCLLVGSSYAAISLVDDFNDGNAAGWISQNGTISEAGGVATGTVKTLATMDGQASYSIGVDAMSQPGLDYVALILNYSSLEDNLFVKIQDNDSDGKFDTIYFLHGNNGTATSGISGTKSFTLDSEVSSTYFQLTDNGDGTVSAYISATGETFGGTLNHTYTGTGVGLGFFGNGQADNFYVTPEPMTISLLALGGLMLRRRRKA